MRIAVYLNLALAFVATALGAHGLEDALGEAPLGESRVTAMELASLVHALLAISLLVLLGQGARPAVWVLLWAGMITFSGSLYAYALAEVKALMPGTVVGVALFTLGFLIAAFRKP